MNDRVELDRLADYAAGVLDGTPAGAEIARLVASDEAWAAAYAELMDADRTIRDELAALRTVAEPMPADVSGRLDAALAGAAATHTSWTAAGRSTPTEPVAGEPMAAADPEPAGSPGAARSPGTAGSPVTAGGPRTARATGAHRADRPPQRSDRRTPDVAARARRRRRLTLAAVAAGVLALGGIGVPLVTPGLRPGVSVESGRAQLSEPADREADTGSAPGAAGPLVRVPVLLASGTDYAAADLTRLAAQRSRSAAAPPGAAGDSRQWSAALVPPALQGLLDPATRNACLQQLTTQYGGSPDTVDFARFEGEPALVVVLVGAGARPVTVVVAGPGCGQAGSTGDVRRIVS